MIVSSPNPVTLAMGKLAFDHVGVVPVLIQDCAGSAAKPMTCRTGMVAHAVQCVEHRVLTHLARWLVLVREHVAPLPGERLELFQYSEGLPGKRHNVRVFHFHAFGRDAPFRLVEVYLRPFGTPKFAS